MKTDQIIRSVVRYMSYREAAMARTEFLAIEQKEVIRFWEDSKQFLKSWEKFTA